MSLLNIENCRLKKLKLFVINSYSMAWIFA